MGDRCDDFFVCRAEAIISPDVYKRQVQRGSAPVDTAFGLGMMGGRKQLLQFINTPNSDRCLDLENVTPLSDSEFLILADELLDGVPIACLMEMHHRERDQILRQFKTVEGVTVRQIARLTGLGRWVVSNA